jgi:hypothetical protein
MQKISLIILFSLIAIVNASTIFNINLTSGTIYQNTNTTPLYLYARTLDTTKVFIGATPNTLLEVQNFTAPSTPHRDSALSVIPQNYYYEVNYTGTTHFTVEYITPQIPILIPAIPHLATYSEIAIIIFLIALALLVLLLLFTLGQEIIRLPRSSNPRINALAIFLLGMSSMILFLISGFYQQQLTVNVYKATTANVISTITTATLTTEPLATNILFGSLIYLLSLIAFIMGFFLPAFYFIFNKRLKKYKVR